MRHSPAAALPHAVLSGSGHSCVAGSVSSSAKIPTLAAVSPNLVAGPCTSANGSPWYRRGSPPCAHSARSDDCKLPPYRYW